MDLSPQPILTAPHFSLRLFPRWRRGLSPEGSSAAVLDAGGTNFRGAIVSIPPKISDKQNQPMPGTKGEVDEETFYNAFASEVKRLEGKPSCKKLGWCFSYPAEATKDLDAKLVRWTKNIKAPAIVGQFVGKELLKRTGGEGIAVVNDTVATLLAAKATEGDKTYSSYIGFILGTGTNTAYVEKNKNILKMSGLDPEGSMIINAESGAFDKAPRSKFDDAADAKTGNPGIGLLEKMIAGAYLGGVGLEIYKAAAKLGPRNDDGTGGFFSKEAIGALGGLGSLETMDFDNFCAGFKKEGRDNVLDTIFADPDDAKLAKRLGLPVFERAAVLSSRRCSLPHLSSSRARVPMPLRLSRSTPMARPTTRPARFLSTRLCAASSTRCSFSAATYTTPSRPRLTTPRWWARRSRQCCEKV